MTLSRTVPRVRLCSLSALPKSSAVVLTQQPADIARSALSRASLMSSAGLTDLVRAVSNAFL